MYNACLKGDARLISQLATKFQFGQRLEIRRAGLGDQQSTFTVTPSAIRTTKKDGVTVFQFGNLPKKHGLPRVEVVARVTSNAFSRTPTIRQPGKELLEANARWPSDDPQVIALAKQITSGKKTPNDKVDAILGWLRPGRNLRYAGQVVGSRYGVKKVLQQKFGHWCTRRT
jgi:transglutaminase-like putative cysteine protease